MNKNRVVNIVKVSDSTSWRDWMRADGFRNISGVRELSVSSEVDLVLSDDSFQYSISNKAEPVLNDLLEQVGAKGVTGAVLKAGEAISTLAGDNAASFNPWFKHVKAWRNTDPVALPLRFEFKLGQFGLWDAKQEVVLPILALLVPVLPLKVDNLEMQGPFQTATRLLTEVLKGTAVSLVESGGDIAASISGAVLSEIAKSTYRVSIGKQLLLDYAYCVEASVTLSTNVDQNGMPISGSIQLRFEGSIPPAIDNRVARSLRFFNAD